LLLFAERVQAHKKRCKTLEKHQFGEKSADQRTITHRALIRRSGALIRRFFGNWCFVGILRRFLRCREHSANSEKIDRLINLGPETRGKWRPCVRSCPVFW